jgi:hypothetical protein
VRSECSGNNRFVAGLAVDRFLTGLRVGSGMIGMMVFVCGVVVLKRTEEKERYGMLHRKIR